MKLDDNARRILKKIVERHGNDVALLFEKYGFNAPVSIDTVVNAFIANQGKFVDDLISIGVADDPEIIPDNLDLFDDEDLDESYSQDGFFGLGNAGNPEKGKKLAAFFNNIGGLVTGVKVLGKAAKNSSKESAEISKMESEIHSFEDKKIMGVSSSIFYGSLVIVVLITIMLLINHYKKNN